jgi:ribokinase
MSKKIIVIGSSNTDMVVKSSKLPLPGETILGGNFLMNAGGKGANQAVAAAKLGAKVLFVCKVGDDVFGKQAIEGFKKAGINTNFVFTDTENPSGVALILVDDKGENSIAVASGANGNLQIKEVEKAIENVKEGDIVLLQLETPIKTIEFAVEACYKRKAKVILNPAPAQKLNEKIFKHLSFITPNEIEAELLTGIKVTDENSAEKAATILIEKGVQNVIITLGSKGAFFCTKSKKQLIPTKTVKAIDTTAAGDVFNGALAVALSNEIEIEYAITYACKAASISVTRMGAQASAPTKEEIV